MKEEKVCRNTIQKQLVMQAVNELCNHPSAEEIYEQILKTAPHISKATVYRNLANLCESGEILKICVANSSDRFDFNNSPHFHMQCNECKRVFDVNFDELDMSKVCCDAGFEITGYSLLFEGKCNCCK